MTIGSTTRQNQDIARKMSPRTVQQHGLKPFLPSFGRASVSNWGWLQCQSLRPEPTTKLFVDLSLSELHRQWSYPVCRQTASGRPPPRPPPAARGWRIFKISLKRYCSWRVRQKNSGFSICSINTTARVPLVHLALLIEAMAAFMVTSAPPWSVQEWIQKGRSGQCQGLRWI